jgi:hypothetical protein
MHCAKHSALEQREAREEGLGPGQTIAMDCDPRNIPWHRSCPVFGDIDMSLETVRVRVRYKSGFLETRWSRI